MYGLFKNTRGQKEEKARVAVTPWKKKDKKKLDVSRLQRSQHEIHLEKSLVPSKPTEPIVILPNTPLCQGPRVPHRRDSYSTITTIDDLEAASSSCVQSQITELSEGIPHFISFVSAPEEEEPTISASNMPLIQKAKKLLPDATNVAHFHGYDVPNDIYASAEFTTPTTPANPHARKSPKQLLNQMDSFSKRNKRDGRPTLRRGESMGLNALSPPLRSGTLSPPLRSVNRVGRRRIDRLEI